MAVVQISRIQIRRGQANGGTGFPQLASGELGWAIDTQQLYIGNGAVSEGSPAVGNTKILTQNDLTGTSNLLQQVQHIYKVNDATLQTGPTANSPISRYLQARLDDRVTTTDFGTIGDGAADDTIAIQRAINQLFLNATTKASANTTAGTSKRIVLEMPAGTFKTTGTIYIPSYASLIGAGNEKTIINYNPTTTFTGTTTSGNAIITTTSATAAMITGNVSGTGIPTGSTIINAVPGVSITISGLATASGSITVTYISPAPAIQFVNDTSTPGNPSSIGSTLGSNQPRNIRLANLTIRTSTGKNTGLQLDAARDCVFENINLQGDWGSSYNILNRGIYMQSLSAIVTCEHNIFTNIKFKSCTFGVWAKQDVRYNLFEDCFFDDGYQGFAFGVGADSVSVGQLYGPRETEIINSKFYNIKRHAVYCELGSNNTTRSCKYINVGNNGAGNTGAIYPQVYWKTAGNASLNDSSDRGGDLSTGNLTVPYIPEGAGHAVYNLQGNRQIGISYVTTNLTLAFRLPLNTDQFGIPAGGVSYVIDYIYKSNTNNFTRRGTMTLSADVGSAQVQLCDEFDFAGNDSSGNSVKLDFSAGFLDSLGSAYTGAVGQSPYSIIVYYTNTLTSDTGSFIYSYKSTI
jgi:hypothetical protein